MFRKKAEDVRLNISNILTGINGPKTLTKHASCDCKYKFVGRKYNLNQN